MAPDGKSGSNRTVFRKKYEFHASFEASLRKRYESDNVMLHDPLWPEIARQGYMEVMGKRMMVCFTSKQRARLAKYNMSWDIAKARDIMNNMFNKDSIAGMVFNPDDEKMIIILKDLLLPIMPGEKSRPEFYRE